MEALKSGTGLCACALVLVFISGTCAAPVYPEFDLGLLPPSMACLFICNICFDNEPVEMMTCANEACKLDGSSLSVVRMLQLGRQCQHFDLLESLVTTAAIGGTVQQAAGIEQTTGGYERKPDGWMEQTAGGTGQTGQNADGIEQTVRGNEQKPGWIEQSARGTNQNADGIEHMTGRVGQKFSGSAQKAARDLIGETVGTSQQRASRVAQAARSTGLSSLEKDLPV